MAPESKSESIQFNSECINQMNRVLEEILPFLVYFLNSRKLLKDALNHDYSGENQTISTYSSLEDNELGFGNAAWPISAILFGPPHFTLWQRCRFVFHIAKLRMTT